MALTALVTPLKARPCRCRRRWPSSARPREPGPSGWHEIGEIADALTLVLEGSRRADEIFPSPIFAVIFRSGTNRQCRVSGRRAWAAACIGEGDGCGVSAGDKRAGVDRKGVGHCSELGLEPQASNGLSRNSSLATPLGLDYSRTLKRPDLGFSIGARALAAKDSFFAPSYAMQGERCFRLVRFSARTGQKCFT
jgi:hypothetical protein